MFLSAKRRTGQGIPVPIRCCNPHEIGAHSTLHTVGSNLFGSFNGSLARQPVSDHYACVLDRGFNCLGNRQRAADDIDLVNTPAFERGQRLCRNRF